MDILLLDALVPDAVEWLAARHQVQFQPELADDLPGLQRAGSAASGIVFPRQMLVTAEVLSSMPRLKAVARLHVSTDNTDRDICKTRGIKVIHASSANVRSNAEYLLSSLLLLYRRGLVASLSGRRYPTAQLGRELHGSTVGLLGLAPAAHTLAKMLHSLGVRVIGYDPAVHSAAPLWEALHVQPVSLAELLAHADAVSVQMLYATRFKGFLNNRVLAHCKPNQLWVGISRSALYDPPALATALCDGRIEAFMIDGAEASFTDAQSPLGGLKNLFVTPRLGSQTREARLRSSWYVAHRLHEAIAGRASAMAPWHSAPIRLEAEEESAVPSTWLEPDAAGSQGNARSR